MGSNTLKRALIFSLAVHMMWLLGVYLLSLGTPERHTPETLLVELEPPEKKVKAQIVSSKAGEEANKAKDNAFLGEKTRVVEEETMGKRGDLQAKKSQPKNPEQTLDDQNKNQKGTPLAKFGVPMFDLSKKNKPNRPEWVDFSAQFGEQYPDYVKGMKESETTALNTKEFVYYSYYQRIRKQLDQAWRPILRSRLERLFRAGRRLASSKDHVTRTVVILDKGGEVVRVQLLEESGLKDLDSAAIRAFNKAGPFPNPPIDLVESDGTIKIRWDFVLRT